MHNHTTTDVLLINKWNEAERTQQRNAVIEEKMMVMYQSYMWILQNR